MRAIAVYIAAFFLAITTVVAQFGMDHNFGLNAVGFASHGGHSSGIPSVLWMAPFFSGEFLSVCRFRKC